MRLALKQVCRHTPLTLSIRIISLEETGPNRSIIQNMIIHNHAKRQGNNRMFTGNHCTYISSQLMINLWQCAAVHLNIDRDQLPMMQAYCRILSLSSRMHSPILLERSVQLIRV
jgi:hypothetical protein